MYMSSATFQALAKCCDAAIAAGKGVECLPHQYMAAHPLDTLASIYQQRFVRFVKLEHHTHRKRAREYVERYHQGERIVDIADKVNFSPYLLARIVAGEMLGLPKPRLAAQFRDLSTLPDERLQRELQDCIDLDPSFSPQAAEVRRSVGLEYECYLQQLLTSAGLPFETEDMMRERGMAKTPDIRLLVPMAVRDAASRWRVVTWVDSKAMFGDRDTFSSEHSAQLLGYVNRFGPGLVIYWFGCEEALRDADQDVMVTCEFPAHVTSLLELGAAPDASAAAVAEQLALPLPDG